MSTLDHYLPKTKYPTFAITPENLIAACSDCNKGKNDGVSTNIENSIIHPYYDDFEDEIWMKVKIIEDFPIGFHFKVVKPTKWNLTKFERAKMHFQVFGLSKLYSSHVVEIFIPYAIQLKRLYIRSGEEGIKEDLIDRIESHREFRINFLEAALYEALLNNKWFFDTYMPEKIK